MNIEEKVDKQDCIGCMGCVSVCPVNALKIKQNEEGFEYPCIDESICVKCGKCLKACPVLANKKNVNRQSLYAVRNKNEDIVANSSSGGFFSAIAEYILSVGGVVYGVEFDESFNVVYAKGTKISDIEKMRSSKYVEAYLPKSIVDELIQDIKNSKKILFSGTPCQIHGLKTMLNAMNISDDNVVWLDFFRCSGKVSRILWQDERKKISGDAKLLWYSFRSKINGWKTFSIEYKTEKEKKATDFLTHRWSKYLGNPYAKRISCSLCGYQNDMSQADISMGDMWYNVDIPKNWKNNTGISIIAIRSDKVRNIINELDKYIDIKAIDVEISESKETFNSKTEEYHKSRLLFWNEYKMNGYDALCNKYAVIGVRDKVLFGIVRPILIKSGLLERIKK